MSDPAAKRSIVTTIVALVLAALYVAASWYLLQRFALDKPLPELSWQRALIIFSGITSVGFAAIGVLLGTTVQQVNIAAAREQASAAKAEADKKTKAIKGAITKLTGPPATQPADLGGGPMTEATRVAEAHRALLDGLS